MSFRRTPESSGFHDLARTLRSAGATNATASRLSPGRQLQRIVSAGAALVGDFLRAALAAADDFLVFHAVGRDDLEREILQALGLQFGFDFGLEFFAGFLGHGG